MAKTYKLSAQARDGAGKGIARALRRDKKIPAVIYGDSKEPILISVLAHDIEQEYHKAHMFTMICDIEVGNDTKEMVLARDIQVHPVTGIVIHADFLRVTKKTKIAVQVPVNFINEEECVGMSKGGVLNVVRHDVELMCSATHIPESVDLDMTKFEIGDSIKMSDIAMTEGAFSTSDRDLTIATIIAPRVEEEETEETEEGEVAAEGEEASSDEADAEGDAK
jgi:large subunit ribosomal protein L25